MIPGQGGPTGVRGVPQFPALYRMPVAYLAAAVLVPTIYASGRLSSRREAASATRNVAAPPIDSNASRSRALIEPSHIATSNAVDSILRDRDGFRRKIVVTGKAVALRPTTDGNPTGVFLDAFAIRLIYAETGSLLQVGTGTTGPEGWVSRGDVSEWNSRLVAQPTARSNRPVVEIFGERECLESALSGRICPRHGGRCPTEVENGGVEGTGPFDGWPILRFALIPGNDGSPRRVDEVIPLVSESAPSDSERLAPLRPALRRVYVAFVIDTTASMRPAIGAARALASTLASAVAKQFGDVSLHLSLVEYRDDSPGLGFKARVATPFTDAIGFRAVINSLEAASREDATPGESVLDGIELSLPGTPGGLDWPTGRAGELATKMIVLLGDSPDHSRDLDRPAALAARARAGGISIASIALDRPGVLPAEDHDRLGLQWHALADGSYRPPDRARSFTGPLPPASIRIEGGATLAPRIHALVEDRVERARGLAELAAAEDEGRLEDYLRSRGLTPAQAAPILDDLRRGDPVPKRTRRHVPSLRSGWLAERVGETDFVTIEILLSRDELDNLISLLSATAIDPVAVRAIVVAASSGELKFLQADLGSVSAEEWLRRRRAFPDPIQSTGDLATRVRAAIDGLAALRDTVARPESRTGVEAKVAVPFALIDF